MYSTDLSLTLPRTGSRTRVSLSEAIFRAGLQIWFTGVELALHAAARLQGLLVFPFPPKAPVLDVTEADTDRPDQYPARIPLFPLHSSLGRSQLWRFLLLHLGELCKYVFLNLDRKHYISV